MTGKRVNLNSHVVYLSDLFEYSHYSISCTMYIFVILLKKIFQFKIDSNCDCFWCLIVRCRSGVCDVMMVVVLVVVK